MDQMSKSLAIIDTVEIQQVQATMNKISQFQQVIQKTLHQGHDFGIIPGTDKPTLLKPGAEKILMMMGLRSEFEIVDSARDFEKGFFQYQVRCKLLKGDMVITEGLGACNTREKKYLKMDPYTMDNTVLKMAKKRALVDAALLVASLSDVFTQDLEDIDLTGEQVSTARKYATDQDGTISKAQAKRMFALAKGDGDLVKAIIKEYGFERSEEVLKIKYDEICKKIEEGAKENGKEKQGKTAKTDNDLERTRKALFAKAKELNYSNDEIKDFLVAKFNTESTKILTKELFIEFYKFLEEQNTEYTFVGEEDAAFAQGEL